MIINELSWAGSSYSSSDEIIELKNSTSENIEMGGWYLTKLSNGQETLMLEIPEDHFIRANDFYIIANFPEAESVIDFEPDLQDRAVSLSNSTLLIRLYDQDGILIDQAGDGGAPLDGDAEFFASMVRNIPIKDGNLADSWSAGLLAKNLDADAIDFASFGAENFLSSENDDGCGGNPATDDAMIIEIEDDLPIEENEIIASADLIIDEDSILATADVEIIETFASDDVVLTETNQTASSDTCLEEMENVASGDAIETDNGEQEEDEAIIDEEPDNQDVAENLSSIEDEPISNQAEVLINEVAFKETIDWVELRVLESGIIENLKLFQGETLIAEVKDLGAVKKDQYILIDLEKNLTATDNILVLRDEKYQVLDVLIYANNDGKFTKSQSQANFLVEAGQWLSAQNFQTTDAGAWTSSVDLAAGMSLSRVSGIDTDSRNDWMISEISTPGLENSFESEEIVEEVNESSLTDEETEPEDISESREDVVDEKRVDLVGKLSINEIMSQPFSGQTEWVEIFNSSDVDIDASDFYLQEGGNSKFYLKGIIPAKFYMIVKTKNLNNAGDQIRLFSKNGQLLDEIIYGDLPGSALEFDQKKVVLPYALVKDDSGFWTLTSLPTPASKNIIEERPDAEAEEALPAEEKKTVTASAKTVVAKQEKAESIVELTLDSAENLKDDALVFFEGQVTVAPGLFYKQKMYVQNEELAAEIYFYKAEWPDLEIGQRVKVSGRFSKKEIYQIKIDAAESIVFLEDDEIIGQTSLDLDRLPELKGFLIEAEGEVSEKLAGGFNLVTTDGDLKVCVKKNTGLSLKDLENGRRVFLSGVLMPEKDGYCLTPRIEADITILPDEAPTVVSAIVEKSTPQRNLPVKIILGIAAGVLTGVLGALSLSKKLKIKALGAAKSG